jgi:hypothetical protein
MVLVHLLFKRSKECDCIRCECAILPQTRPQYQRRRTKNELGSAIAHRVFVYALMCFAALLYVLYVIMCSALSKTWDFLWGVALWQAHNFLELSRAAGWTGSN